MADTLPPLPDADYWSTRDDDTPLFTADQMLAYAAAAVQAEREACAKLCDAIEGEYQRTESRKFPELKSDAQTGASDCAAAIRTRKTT